MFYIDKCTSNANGLMMLMDISAALWILLQIETMEKLPVSRKSIGMSIGFVISFMKSIFFLFRKKGQSRY